jgi:sn-glycerol 3-phosphate transport system permease protein
MIIPMVSAAALWLFIFMPGLGLLDHYLAKLFGPMNNNWLGRSNSALLALALIGVWKFAGYYMLFSSPGCRASRPQRAKRRSWKAPPAARCSLR